MPVTYLQKLAQPDSVDSTREIAYSIVSNHGLVIVDIRSKE